MRKFVVILLLKIPPHLKCVATLPSQISSDLKATIGKKFSGAQLPVSLWLQH